jgi:hypothetical protein
MRLSLLAGLIGVLLWICPANADQVYCFLNSGRSKDQIEQDVRAVYGLILKAKPGDEIICRDMNDKEICHYVWRKATRLVMKRDRDAALNRLRAYALAAIDKINDTDTHNTAQFLNRVSHRTSGSNAHPFVVVFGSMIHHIPAFSFKEAVPSDGFILSPPFSLVPSLHGARFVFLVDESDFVNLKHRTGMQGWVARLLDQHDGVLVGFTHVHDQISRLINKNSREPIIRDLALRDNDLVLHRVDGSLLVLADSEPAVVDTPGTLHEDQIKIKGRVATITGKLSDPSNAVWLQADETRFSIVADDEGQFTQDIILKRGMNSVVLYDGAVLLDSLLIDAPDLDVPAVRVSLTWSADTDVDLYVLKDGNRAVWFRQMDSFGALDRDDRTAKGPEHISIHHPFDGILKVYVHWYQRGGHEGPVNYTVEVYQEDRLTGRFEGTLFVAVSEQAGPSNAGKSESWAHVTDIRLKGGQDE